MKRTLTLTRDVLAVLSDDELTDVVGAGPLPTLPPFECIASNYGPCTVL